MPATSPQPVILITGMGCCCAAGSGVGEIAAALDRSPVRCGPVPRSLFATPLTFPAFFLEPPFPSSRAAFLLTGSPEPAALPPQPSRTSLLALEALAEALDDAGLSPESLRRQRVGVVIGTTVGSTFNNETYYTNWRQGTQQDIGPVFTYLGNNLATLIQAILGLHGPAAVVTNACSSGTDAIGLAKIWLEQDLCDLVIAGGADELARIAYHGFAALMLLSETPCRPFDRDRNGLNLGEGAGIVILEREDRRAGETVAKGWLRGYGSATDGYHPTAPHPDGKGIRTALDLALADAGLTAPDIAYINAHGTGTRANDTAETAALAQFHFSQACPIVSSKGLTGHTLGAAGAIEAIITLLTLGMGSTAGTNGCRQPDPDLPVQVLPEGQSMPLQGKIGISQSLGFGGFNGVLILEALP